MGRRRRGASVLTPHSLGAKEPGLDPGVHLLSPQAFHQVAPAPRGAHAAPPEGTRLSSVRTAWPSCPLDLHRRPRCLEDQAPGLLGAYSGSWKGGRELRVSP
ncbi:hypothetical protein MJG53_013002 [Ovis ammon polii x Ovis aries]|uniref:Uncharacterized protein n=2 Tax=Ovis TaxID=9935 RepID=A0AAD4TVB0_OVIAM|nr:hypothetical protein MG293_014384 [Ovis ammon polii]KAI4560423.1 hypothetical protein MJT46_012661 [Ovis ammon polii x Ovis aries]KAI4573164.1 hypothetical protein MJG53_013002 [Ovis ammon polii x Ovis aries]